MATVDSAAAPMRQGQYDDDIVVAIQKGFHCQFQGTADQLRAEGLLPNDQTLPLGRRSVEWTDKNWSFKLVRARAPGSTASVSEWKNQDWWRLYRWSIATNHQLSMMDARKLAIYEELKWLQWAGSPAGKRHANLSWDAKRNPKLQAFIASLDGGKR